MQVVGFLLRLGAVDLREVKVDDHRFVLSVNLEHIDRHHNPNEYVSIINIEPVIDLYLKFILPISIILKLLKLGFKLTIPIIQNIQSL